jgi:hypothetical protein
VSRAWAFTPALTLPAQDEAKQHARSEIARLEGNGDATHKSHEHAHGEPAKIHDQQVHDHQ